MATKSFDFKRLLDTTDPDNDLGPPLLAVAVSCVIAVVVVILASGHLP